jgi:hypothetical protein
VVDTSALAEVRERTPGEAGARQVSPMYLNEYTITITNTSPHLPPAGETPHWGFLTKSSLCYIMRAASSRPSLVNLVSQRELRNA